jgi:phosphohistidine phosphatase
MLPALGDPEVWIEVTLYAASAETLLARVQALPKDVDEVMLVGHNPGVADLVVLLSQPGRLRDRAAENVPTGALAVLEAGAVRWTDVASGRAALTRLVLPRQLT